MNIGAVMAIGIGVGTAFGVALDNVGAGIALGAGIGGAFWAAFNGKDKGPPDDE